MNNYKHAYKFFILNTFIFVCWKWQDSDMKLEVIFNSFKVLEMYIGDFFVKVQKCHCECECANGYLGSCFEENLSLVYKTNLLSMINTNYTSHI
jgi:hypothetical protein